MEDEAAESSADVGLKRSKFGRRRRKQRNCKTKQKPVVCDQDRKMIELRQWMKVIAGFRCPLIPASFHDTGRGLMTKQSISSGDVLISLPKALLITTETVLSSQAGEHVKRWEPRLTPQEAISVFIIWEHFRNSLSPWKPYLSVLPKKFTTPGYFIDSELSLLPTSVYYICIKDIQKIKKSYAKISEYSKSRWTDLYNILSHKTFIWAWYVINTRSVYLNRERSDFLSSEEEDHLALAPFLDLLNHSASANVSAGFNPVSQCYEIRTFDDYKKFSQVFLSYGQHDNNKLFIEYGFYVPDNPNDVYEFSYDDILEIIKEFKTQYTEKKLQILRENKLLQSACCSIDGVSWKLWTVLKTLAMNWDQLQNWSDVYKSGHGDDGLFALATGMGKFLINKALLQSRQGLKKILQIKEEDLNPEHVGIARTLTEIEINILTRSLSLLR